MKSIDEEIHEDTDRIAIDVKVKSEIININSQQIEQEEFEKVL